MAKHCSCQTDVCFLLHLTTGYVFHQSIPKHCLQYPINLYLFGSLKPHYLTNTRDKHWYIRLLKSYHYAVSLNLIFIQILWPKKLNFTLWLFIVAKTSSILFQWPSCDNNKYTGVFCCPIYHPQCFTENPSSPHKYKLTQNLPQTLHTTFVLLTANIWRILTWSKLSVIIFW